MTKPDLKLIEKLAKQCRKVGIKHFKNADFEFTLTDDDPIEIKKIKAKNKNSSTNSITPMEIESDTLSQEQLLFYSTIDLPEENKEVEQ